MPLNPILNLNAESQITTTEAEYSVNVAVSGTADVDWAWGKKFRAYDKANGRVLWEMELPSGTTAGPMTYMLRGKQYIVVSVGAMDHAPEYVALSLP